MRKKLAGMLLVAVMTVTALAGCGSTTNETAEVDG